MPGHVFVVVMTPDGEVLSRCLAEALDKAGKLLLDNGWADGYFVTLTIEVREREIDEDTTWLERRLERQ